MQVKKPETLEVQMQKVNVDILKHNYRHERPMADLEI